MCRKRKRITMKKWKNTEKGETFVDKRKKKHEKKEVKANMKK